MGEALTTKSVRRVEVGDVYKVRSEYGGGLVSDCYYMVTSLPWSKGSSSGPLVELVKVYSDGDDWTDNWAVRLIGGRPESTYFSFELVDLYCQSGGGTALAPGRAGDAAE